VPLQVTLDRVGDGLVTHLELSANCASLSRWGEESNGRASFGTDA